MKNRIIKVIKLMSVLLISLVVFSSVYAQNVKLKDVKITDKNIEIEDPVISGNEITNEINLNEVGNFVTYEITIQNNDSYDYTIDSIEDNNKNKNISLSYIYSKENIKKNGEYKFKVTVLYKNRLENIEEINLKDTKITINLIREDGKESSIVVNPTTGDSILKYFLLLILVLVGVILKQKKKVFYKVLFIIPIILLPLVIFANESFKQDVIFKSINVKGVMLPYEVTINVPGEDPIIKTVIYGNEIGELPDVNVDGYEFNGWEDDKGNTVDEHTKVTGKIEVTPKLSPIIYTITYDLQGGTATGNKETYTVETDTFTLVNPSKRGYSFSGWTGSNGDSLQTEVTVYKGTTGNLNYKAHYRQTENIPYKVIHRKQKLSLDGYDIEEEQIEHGSAGTTVRPQTREYEGFISPEEQELIITDDGLASITYDYNRAIYSYVVDTNTNSTIPSGDYPYGTEATITANNVPGYTFEKWSDDETTNPRDIIISEGTTNIKPVYKANTNTPYVVIHYQMNIDGVNYTEFERETLTGTTDTEITPDVKTYTGFTSPSPKTDTIKGDGTTIIEYYYSRNDITITIDIPGEDPITKTVKYDDVIGELPTPSKDGYTFDGYEDGDHNKVDENTKVHGEMTITPVFSAIEYTISYDLNGGLNHSENPDKYTIESNNITLKDASRSGYTFIGWTGSNGKTPQKNVVIEKGTIGNKSYKANYSKSTDGLDISLDTVSYPYDGNPKTPEVTIKDGDVVLVEGRDYTVEYSDNVNAGNATVTITMTGEENPDTGVSYEGTKELHFDILAIPPLVELINTSKEYTGEPIVFTEEDVRITPASGGEISFKYCTDETCEHEVSSIEEAGTYYVVAHVGPNGNYSESDSEPTIITIERKGIDVPKVTSTFTYTGNDQELLSDTEYYTVTNNIAKNVGTYDVLVTPTNNYKWSDGTTTPKIVTVTINPYDINNGSVVPVEEYSYDGSEKKPTPSVIVPIPSSIDTTILTSSDLDYTYENNINAGEAEVIITGKGNYTGTITKTFTIEKADGTIELSRTSDNIIYGTDSITVDVLNSTGEIEANTTTSGVQVSVNGNTITITGLSSIDSGETVEVKVKAKTSTNYKESEETYKVTVSDAAITGGSVTITGVNGVGETLTASVEDTTPKATYTYEWYRNDEDSMTGGTKIEGETNNTYTLTNNDIGKYVYVVVTASKQNYTPITFKDKVDAENNRTDKTKIEIEIPVSTNTCKNLTYNGDSQILTNESGEGYAYINNSGVNVGEYTVEARLEENYMWSDYTFNNKPVTCVINKKNVIIKADNQTKIYDSTPLTSDNTCTDKNSDLISGHLPVCTSTGTITNVGNETKVLNTVIIKQNETDLTNNYNITKENGDLSVTTRDITCTSSSNTKVYDGQPLTDNTGTCTNLVPNQTATFNNTGTATNVSDTVEENNTLESVTITDQDSVNVTTNYNIAKHNGTLTITRANSTCEITNNPVLYYPGDNTGSITYACTGDGELSVTSNSNVITVSNVTRTSSALTSANTGTSTITVSKAEGPNYNSTSAVKEITVNASIYHVIFDKNDEAATGVMEPQDITYGVATTLNENQYSKSGYVFVGWNTEPDGTGNPYTDKQEVTSLAESGNITLYAQWITAQAMFSAGTNVNAKMKKLAGNSSATYSSEDTNITSIQKSITKPDISTMTNDNIVSISNATYNTPIYMWYDNGTIYWWSEDNDPSLNQDSSYLFSSLTGLTNIDVTHFNTSYVTNMESMFYKCSSLINLDLSSFNTSKVTDMSILFSVCSSLTSLNLSSFSTSQVTDMDRMFYGCESLTSLDLGENFDTSNVTDMTYMFYDCSSLTSLDLGDKFDTSKVTDMPQMFGYCRSLTSLDLGENFDTSSVTVMSNMFYICDNLTSLDLGDNFDTSNVTTMITMFSGCQSLTSLDLGDKFDTSKVTDMRYMFSDCSSLTTIYATNLFVTTSVTYSNQMFYRDTKLVGGMGTTFSSSHIDATYAHIDGGTSNPGYFTDKSSINIRFDANGGTGTMNDQVVQYDVATPLNANTFTKAGYIFVGWNTKADGSGTAYADGANIQAKSVTTLYAQWLEAQAMFDTGQNVNNKMKRLAGNASVTYSSKDTNITSIQKSTTKPDISSFTSDNIVSISNTTYNTPIYMWYDNGTIYWWSEDNTPNLNQNSSFMFRFCEALTSISFSSWNTSAVTNMQEMFYYCYSLSNFDFTNIDTSNVTNMNGMFSMIYDLNVDNSVTTLDLSNFNTSNVVDMGNMFSNCNKLTNLNLSSFNTSNVTYMHNIFYRCSSLTSLDLGDKFDTSNVTNMSNMFGDCSSLTLLDLGSKFDTSNVTKMEGMFSGCSSLTTLDLGDNFDTSKVTNMSNMFFYCSSLTSLDLSSFDTSNVTTMYVMFYNDSNLTTIYATNAFVTTSITESTNMFYGDRKIVGGAGTTYNSSHIDATYAHIDGGTSNPGYFTDKSTISIKFDANGGTGTMNDQIVQYNVSTPLNTNTYTRSGYIFNGWNTLPDGTGTSFSDGANIQVKSLTMLYAQWIEDRPESATFDTGQNVVTKMKKLADGEGTNISRNQTIRSIKYTTTKPDISLMNSDNILSSANSESVIYSWYENQTIYIYSNARNIYLNEDSSYMFCNLTVLTNLDLSSFNTSRVTNMLMMFSSLTSITSLDLSSFDTSNVTNMQQMFSNCTSLTSLNLSSFNTSNVTNMLSMFSSLTSITSLDLSSFNTRKVLYLKSMFSGCNLLRTIYASNNFVTTSVTNGGTVFYGCTSLKGGAGTSYNSSYIDKTYARIDGGTSNPGYFTYKAAPTGGNISRFINAFSSLNAKISKYVLGVFIVIALILSTVLLIIRSIKKRKIRNN